MKKKRETKPKAAEAPQFSLPPDSLHMTNVDEHDEFVLSNAVRFDVHRIAISNGAVDRTETTSFVDACVIGLSAVKTGKYNVVLYAFDAGNRFAVVRFSKWPEMLSKYYQTGRLV